MDIDYGALFGIDEGGKEQEIADPATDETTQAQGAEEQEAADPAEEETQDTSAEEPQGAAEDGEDHSETGKQTPEQNAAFAAARRKAEAERDAAVEKARTDAQEEARRTIDEAFRNSGLVNPYTKQPITSKAEYDEYRQRFDAERKARVLKKSGMSDEEFNAFVNDLPEVKQAKEAQAAAERAQQEANEAQARVKVDEQLKEIGKLNPNIRELKDLAAMETYPKFYELVKKSGMSDEEFNAFVNDLPEVKQAKEAQAAAERAQQEANEAQARVKVDEQLKEIGKLNPNIRELKDLAAMETYPKFYELVKKGNTLVDAYRLANFEALTSSAAAATRQAALNNLQGKQHMGQTKERGAGAVSVPAEVKEMYRALNPGATDAEIQAHYNRSHKKG